ncbi:MAG: hypothetical protein AAF202_00760, partial [Pseudomonadota bacterium]
RVSGLEHRSERSFARHILRLRRAFMAAVPGIDPIQPTLEHGLLWSEFPSSEKTPRLTAGSLEIDLSQRQIFWIGAPLKGVNERAFELLLSLISDDTEYISHQDLMQKHGFDHVQDLRDHISTLRNAFREVDPYFFALRNRFNLGYYWSDFAAEAKRVITLGPLSIQPFKNKVFWEGQSVDLDTNELTTLYYLAVHPGAIALNRLAHLSQNPIVDIPKLKDRIQNIVLSFQKVNPDFQNIELYEDTARAIWKRQHESDHVFEWSDGEDVTVFEDMVLDEKKRSLYFAGQWMRMSNTTNFQLLAEFMANPYRIYDGQAAIEAIRPPGQRFYGIDGESYEEIMRTYISRLRRHIERNLGQRFHYIRTVHGTQSYRFVPDGQRVEDYPLGDWKHIGDLSINEENKIVIYQGIYLNLNATEYKFVRALTKHPNEMIPMAGLRRLLAIGGENTAVSAYILRIRNRFRSIDPEFDRIVTWTRDGYSWNAN